jgi:hypothetical protein
MSMWPTQFGGMAIRAEVGRTDASKSWPTTSPTRAGIRSHGPTLTRAAILPELVFGTIIGIVDLIDCVPLEKVEGQPYANGPCCWIPDNPGPLGRSVPLAGKPGPVVRRLQAAYADAVREFPS